MALEGLEVAVTMEKLMALSDAERSDNRIDGLANRHAARAE
jgi:hypothetical protein